MTLYIIIPVYNAARYLPDALNSIISEREKATVDTQVVLINDGSTDNSAEICMDFVHAHPRVHYIYQANQGVSEARSTGLQYIFERCDKDDWIGFLDADDIWHFDWASAIEEGLHSDSDVIGFGMAFADSKLNVSSVRLPDRKSLPGGFQASLSENRKAHFGAYIYRCSLLQNHRISFIPKVTNGEDLIFKYEAFLCANRLPTIPRRCMYTAKTSTLLPAIIQGTHATTMMCFSWVGKVT